MSRAISTNASIANDAGNRMVSSGNVSAALVSISGGNSAAINRANTVRDRVSNAVSRYNNMISSDGRIAFAISENILSFDRRVSQEFTLGNSNIRLS